MNGWMPGAVVRPISYRAAAGRFTHVPLGWILHVVVGNGSPWSGFEHAPAGSRKFSNGWVAKSGRIEQYAETFCKSWAQEDGNGDYLSWETEGFPNEPLTDAQIASLGRIHAYLGTVDELANRPGQKGIGTHYMGGAAWGGHSCPDPVGHEGQGPRSLQRRAIIAASHPAPPPAPPTGDTDMLPVMVKDRPELWVTNGVTRRHVSDPKYRDWLIGVHAISGSIGEVPDVEFLVGVAGPIDPNTVPPKGWVEPTPATP